MKYLRKLYILFALTFLITSCEIGEQVDPNSPSLAPILANANVAQLNNLVSGTLSWMRNDLQVYYDDVGIVGREYYRFSGSDPRFVADLLGQGGGNLDNNAFYTTRAYAARYRAINNANILIDAVNNTSADITNEEKNGYLGFAKTIIAHELLMVLNTQNENGIRLDVTDPDNLGPFVPRDEAMAFIANLLDEAFTDLGSAIVIFPLSSGFTVVVDDNNNPDLEASLRQFNRALAARVAVYRTNWTEALTNLGSSFLDLSGNLDLGVYYVFTLGSGDQANPLFIAPNATGDVRVVREEWVNEAEPGDRRLSKALLRDPDVGPATQAGLSSNYDVVVYQSLTDPMPIIRNEELALIFAEANIQLGNTSNALAAINLVRNEAGLDDYSGPTDQDVLIDEILRQRRYSLFFEGHRWVDMRRYDRLDELPIDRAGDVVHLQFPIPFDESLIPQG